MFLRDPTEIGRQCPLHSNPGIDPKAVAQQRPLPDGPVASRTFMITPMPYHSLSYYRFRMGA
jgi:hypothetical protein